MIKDEFDEILTILSEECAELTIACSKIRRFGSAENHANLVQEMADVATLVVTLKEFMNISDEEFEAATTAKLNKLSRYSSINL